MSNEATPPIEPIPPAPAAAEVPQTTVPAAAPVTQPQAEAAPAKPKLPDRAAFIAASAKLTKEQIQAADKEPETQVETPAAGPAAVAEVETPAEVVAEVVAEPAPTKSQEEIDAETEAAELAAGRQPQLRFRPETNDPVTKMALALMKANPKLTIEQATAGAKTALGQTAETTPTAAPPPKAPEKSSADIEAQIEKLEEEQAEALENHQSITAAEKIREASKLKKELKAVQQQEAQYDAYVTQAHANASQQAVASYPDLAREGDFRDRYMEIHTFLSQNHPDRLDDPNFPKTIADQVAREFNVLPVVPKKKEATTAPAAKAAPPATATTTPKPAPPATPPRPAPAPLGRPQPSSAPDPLAQALRNAPDLESFRNIKRRALQGVRLK